MIIFKTNLVGYRQNTIPSKIFAMNTVMARLCRVIFDRVITSSNCIIPSMEMNVINKLQRITL